MNIPTDIKISVSFIAVLLLGFVPMIAIWMPDILLAIKSRPKRKAAD
jgi:hypothetical protein